MIDIKLDFRIKLLSGNNVVMVEAKGYETEIFMPQILNGRISFQNIIPNRRCCSLAISSSSRIKNQRLNTESGTDRIPWSTTNSRAWRVNGGLDGRTFDPVAQSTPSASTMDKENRCNRRQEVANVSRLPTPEPLRSMAPPNQLVKDKVVQIPSGVKVIHIYHDSTGNDSKRWEIVNNESKKSSHNSANSIISTRKKEINNKGNTINTSHNNNNHNNTSRIGEVPSFGSPAQNNNRQEHSTPLITEYRIPSVERLKKTLQSKKTQVLLPPTPDSEVKWRKCLTPVRTYSRRQLRKPTPLGSARKATSRLRTIVCESDHQNKVVPNYLVNPTQAVVSNLSVEVKKRKLIIDKKTAISPGSFKRQQKESSMMKNRSLYKLPKNRKEYEASKYTAFDMLTNSNRLNRISAKLNEQFRKACVNKTATIIPKYKALCVIPPLEANERNEVVNDAPQNSRKSIGHRDRDQIAKHNKEIIEEAD